MKISWTSFRVSIAGAKLSHLVEKDRIWDHGSMVEQVKNIFYAIERAKTKNETEGIRKCVTAYGFEKLRAQIELMKERKTLSKSAVLTGVSIVQVMPATKQKPDSFKALIKGKRKTEKDLVPAEIDNYGIESFSEEWLFVRQGDWWVLDD